MLKCLSLHLVRYTKDYAYQGPAHREMLSFQIKNTMNTYGNAETKRIHYLAVYQIPVLVLV